MRLRPASLAVTALTVLTACGGGASFSAGTSATAGFETVHGVLGSPGTANDKRFGAAVAWIDWNDDGRLDMAVGMPGAEGLAATEAGLVAPPERAGRSRRCLTDVRRLELGGHADPGRRVRQTLRSATSTATARRTSRSTRPAITGVRAERRVICSSTRRMTRARCRSVADPAGPVTNAFFGAALLGRMGADLPSISRRRAGHHAGWRSAASGASRCSGERHGGRLRHGEHAFDLPPTAVPARAGAALAVGDVRATRRTS
jgi:hypothetical protein